MEAIVADYVGMVQQSDRLFQLSAELVKEINRLKYVLNDVDIFWDGEANYEFCLAMNSDFAVMEALCLQIRVASNLLGEAVNEYAVTEKEIELLIGG